MRGIPQFDSLKAVVPTKNQRWLKSPTGNRGGLMLIRSVEAGHKEKAKSTLRLVSNTSRLHWLRFSVLFLRCKAMPGLVKYKGHDPPVPIVAILNQNDPLPSRRGLQPKRSHPFWIKLPDIHPTKVLFVKDKLPDGFMFPSVAIVLSLDKHVSLSISPFIVHLALFSNSSKAYRSQEWFNVTGTTSCASTGLRP
jgi:hypothetical protein